jgi:hypothetical protein
MDTTSSESRQSACQWAEQVAAIPYFQLPAGHFGQRLRVEIVAAIPYFQLPAGG